VRDNTQIKISENMTAKEVAKYVNVGEKTIRNWTSEGKIPFVKLGSAVRYPKTRIDSWQKTKENKSIKKSANK
jgi:excisionase family DNA binding protein